MVYVFLANGFEEIEALTPIDMLRRAGIETTSVSITSENTVVGAHNIAVLADKTVYDITPDNIDAVILPGGMPGADNLNASQEVHAFIDRAVAMGKPVCAICAAPYILGEKGLLKDKKATCYPGFEKSLLGATPSDDGCIVDGSIVTAKAMGKAIDFSLAIIELLLDKDTAEKIKNSIFA